MILFLRHSSFDHLQYAKMWHLCRGSHVNNRRPSPSVFAHCKQSRRSENKEIYTTTQLTSNDQPICDPRNLSSQPIQNISGGPAVGGLCISGLSSSWWSMGSYSWSSRTILCSSFFVLVSKELFVGWWGLLCDTQGGRRLTNVSSTFFPRCDCFCPFYPLLFCMCIFQNLFDPVKEKKNTSSAIQDIETES